MPKPQSPGLINWKHLLSPWWMPWDYSLIICSFCLNLLGRSAWIPDLPDVSTGHHMPLQIFKSLQFLTSACSDQTTVTLRLISTLLCYLPTPRTGSPCASKFSLNPINVKGEDGEDIPVHLLSLLDQPWSWACVSCLPLLPAHWGFHAKACLPRSWRQRYYGCLPPSLWFSGAADRLHCVSHLSVWSPWWLVTSTWRWWARVTIQSQAPAMMVLRPKPAATTLQPSEMG